MGFIKRVFCKHEKQKCISNIGGDMINHISLRKVYRSAWECEKCGKIIYKEQLEPTCDVVNFQFKK